MQASLPASEFFHDFLGTAVSDVPMLLGTIEGVYMDFGILSASKNVHIAIAARRVAIDDLRLAYRYGLPARLPPRLPIT